jgi:hypothetical protein
MKQATTTNNSDILHKIESIEKELIELKLSVLKNLTPSKKNIISLKGILKGIEISEEEIDKAKKSLYSRIKI